MTLAIGLITPPYGICLLIAVTIAEESVLGAFQACFLLIAVFIGIIVLCVIFPDLILFIPRTFMPRFF